MPVEDYAAGVEKCGAEFIVGGCKTNNGPTRRNNAPTLSEAIPQRIQIVATSVFCGVAICPGYVRYGAYRNARRPCRGTFGSLDVDAARQQ